MKSMDKTIKVQTEIDDNRLGVSINRLFWFFIVLHVIAWTLIPYIVRYNLPMDSIEGAIWGNQLILGYDKNPFLNGWLTALALKLSHHQDWSIYLFSQLSVAICFIAVFSLAKKMLTPAAALASVLILETLQYYNFHAIDFNDNTLELSTWALCSFFFYQAVASHTRDKFRTVYWLLTAIAAAAGMMAKYYTLALLAAMGIFLLVEPQARRAFQSRGFYLAILLFILLLLPHLLWLTQHQYITVQYVFERTQSLNTFWNHLFYPAQFAVQQFEVILPALILLLLLLVYEKLNWIPRTKSLPQHVCSGGGKTFKLSDTNQSYDSQRISSFDRHFLWMVGLGPFVLTLLLGLWCGIRLRAGWGMPLFSLIGILLIASPLFKPSKDNVMRLYYSILVFLCFALGAYIFSLTRLDSTSSATFPGREVAAAITERWHHYFKKPLIYVAGPRFLGGNVHMYSPDHPAVFMEWDEIKSPWIKKDVLLKHGAIFMWNKNKSSNPEIPEDYQQIPYSKEETLKFNWHRSKNSPPIIIGLRFIPPQS